VAIALDTAEGSLALNEALRVTTERILATLPSARLACLNVLKLGRVTIDRTLDEEGNNKHIDRLVMLRHWASPLKLDESRLTVHVLEAVDPRPPSWNLRRPIMSITSSSAPGRTRCCARSWAASPPRWRPKRLAPSPW